MSNPPTLIEYFVAIAQIVGSLATALAFWVTYATLREMKHQTDLSNNPVLKIRFRNWDNSIVETKKDSISKEYIKEDSFSAWRRLIIDNLHQDISGLKDESLILELSNSGKSEITHISFSISLVVQMFDSDVLPINFRPATYTKQIDKIVEIGENGHIFLLLANTRYFPIYSCSIDKLKYKNVRGNSFTNFDGKLSVDCSNEVLRPVAQQFSETQEPEFSEQIDEENLQPDNSQDEIPF